jgi:hypothetical protein
MQPRETGPAAPEAPAAPGAPPTAIAPPTLIAPAGSAPAAGSASAPDGLPGIRISLLLALLPAAQALLDRGWLFDGPGRDPWIYYSYFRFARIYLAEDPDLYYGSRLSVILPGYLLRHLLPAVAAQLALHLTLYGCALAAFYFTARVVAGRRGALLASLLLGGQTYFLWAIGRNYVDGFGITYLLVALAALTAAAASPRRWRRRALLAAAGAAAVALVSANLFYAVYLPLLAACFMVLDRRLGRESAERRTGWRGLLAAAPWAAAGGAAAFAGYDAAGWLWGHGDRFYLAPTLRFLWGFSREPSIFKHPFATWGAHASWLVFPLIVLGGTVAVLARRQAPAPAAGGAAGAGGGAAGGAMGRYFQVQYLACFAAMVAIELEPHGVTLEYPSYASLLLPPACLALAGQLAPLVEGLAPRVFAGFAVALAVALVPASLAGMHMHAAGTPPTIALALGLGALAVAALAAGRRERWRRRGWLGLGPAVLVALALAGSMLAAQAARLRRPGPSADDDPYRFFQQTDGALSALRQVDPSLRLRLWYDTGEEAGPLYDTLATAFRLCRRLVTFSFPDAAGGRMCDGERLHPGMKVAVLSQRPAAATAAAAEHALGAIGLRAHWLEVRPLPGPVASVTMSVLETAPAPPDRIGGAGGTTPGPPLGIRH